MSSRPAVNHTANPTVNATATAAQFSKRAGRPPRREATGLSQDRFDMHRAYYAAIERGEKNTTLPTLKRVADGLGVRMADVLAAIKK